MNTFQNPILRGDYSDPDVIRVHSRYYMISSTMQLCPGMAILESEDLLHWRTINYAINNLNELDPQLNWDQMSRYNNGVYAGSLRYLEWKERDADGILKDRHRWFMHATLFQVGIVVSWADDVYGTWHCSFMKDRNGQELRVPSWDDNCPYWEWNEDGTLKAAYMIASKPGKQWYTRMFQMSLDGTQLLDGDVRFMRLQGDATRVRTGQTPDEACFKGINSGDPIEGELISYLDGSIIVSPMNLQQNHMLTMDAYGRTRSVVEAIQLVGREGTVINDAQSAEASKIIRFPETSEIGRSYFAGRHGDKERICDYVYIFSSEWWDGMRMPILRRAKSVYGDIWSEDGRYLGPGGPGNPGTYEVQRLLVEIQTPEPTREPNQGGYVDIPKELSEDGKEHWYFLTQHGTNVGYPECRPTSLLPVTWRDGWPMIGLLPDYGEHLSKGVPDVQAKPYDGTGIENNKNDSIHHPNQRLIPGVMEWNPVCPPLPMKDWKCQDSDNFGAGPYGGQQNSVDGKLSPNWQWNYVPREGCWSLTERPGYMRLYAFSTVDGSDNLFLAGNVLCQRYLRYQHVLAEIHMELSAMMPGQEAGMLHMNGGRDRSSLGVHILADGRKELCFDQKQSIAIESDEIWIRSVVDESARNQFYYRVDKSEEWKPFGDTFRLIAANYRGDYIGIYTYNNQGSGYVDVEYFRYEYSDSKSIAWEVE